MALGLGVLIGITAFRDDALIKRQETIIARLEKQFLQLQSERKMLQAHVSSLEEKNSKYAAFIQAARKLLISGRLQRHNVALVVCGPRQPKAEANVTHLLAEAGAKVAGIWYLADSWVKQDWTYRREVDPYAEELGWPEGRWTSRLAAGLARQMALQPESDIVSQLENWGVVSAKGLTGEGVDTVVFLGNHQTWTPSSRYKQVQLEVMDALLDLGVVVAAVRAEPWEPVPDELKKRSVATVGQIDSEIGQVLLIQAISDRSTEDACQTVEAERRGGDVEDRRADVEQGPESKASSTADVEGRAD